MPVRFDSKQAISTALLEQEAKKKTPLICTEYYLQSIGRCDCSLASLASKITIALLPVFLLITLLFDLINAIVHCLDKSKVEPLKSSPQLKPTIIEEFQAQS
jgi:hypothetical protein